MNAFFAGREAVQFGVFVIQNPFPATQKQSSHLPLFFFCFRGQKSKQTKVCILRPWKKSNFRFFRDLLILSQGDVFFVFLEALRSVLRRFRRFAIDIHVKVV